MGRFILILLMILIMATVEVVSLQAQPSLSTGPKVSEGYVLTVVIPGSPFHGLHGLTIDSKDQLYVGGVFGQRIYRVDPNTGHFHIFVPAPYGQADDMEFSPNDTLYWTSILTGDIYSRSAEGGPIRRIATGYPGVNPIAFNDEGKLFSAQAFFGDVLWEFDPNGMGKPRKIIEKVGFLNGFDFGPDGNLYSPVYLKGKIARINVNTGKLKTIADGFKSPVAVNFDSKGRLYALDFVKGHVVRINVETGAKEVLAELDPGIDNLAFDSQDRLYVTNHCSNNIYEINIETASVRTVIESGHLVTPGGLAIYEESGSFELHVADTFVYRSIDLNTKQQTREYRFHVELAGAPMSVSVNEEHVLLTSWFAGNVEILDRKSGAIVKNLTGFAAPFGVAETRDGSILVVEGGSGRLVKVQNMSSGDRQIIAEDLGVPCGLVIDSKGIAIVSDTGRGKIFAVNTKNGDRKVLMSGLGMPEGIDIHPDGRLIVAETGKRRIIAIDLDQPGKIEVLAENLDIGLQGIMGTPLPNIPTGIAVSPTGDIYISSDTTNAVFRISQR